MSLPAALLAGIAVFAASLWVLERRRSGGARGRVQRYLGARAAPAPPDGEERAPAGASLVRPVAAAARRVRRAARAGRRRRAFEGQLPDLLADVASALRAGRGFNQALQSVAAGAPEPAAGELARVLSEARLGRPFDEALRAMGERLHSEDLDFVIDAVVVQRQVGGSLARVFEIVVDSVRQRQQHAMRVRALTAMGRASALVVLSLPPAIALLLTALNHAYLAPLLRSPAGRLLLVGAGLSMGIGALWLRALVGVGRRR